MNTILVIAKNTFRQAIRDRILYGILVFALLFIGSTIVLSSLSLGEDIFIIKSLGMAGIYFFSLIITLFFGASTIYDEVERKTSYFLLSKPVSRSDVIVGKAIGLISAVFITTVLMGLAYTAIVLFGGGQPDPLLILVLVFQIIEISILTGALILFSVFTTPMASIIYTILLLYIGHLLTLLKDFSTKTVGVSKIILTSAYYLLPNLEKFNIRNLVVHNQEIKIAEIYLSISYGLIYTMLLLYTAKILLNKKEF